RHERHRLCHIAGAMEREASGHRRQPDGSLQAEPMGHPPKWPPAPQSFSGGGGICSSAPDYLTLIRMLMHGGALNGVRILRPDTVALMGQNQIGLIDVGVLRTTVPAVSRDVDFFPGTKLKWGFGHMITTQPVPEGRSAGSLTWAGIYNTYYWIDPKKRIAAVFVTQVLPFADSWCWTVSTAPAAVPAAFPSACESGVNSSSLPGGDSFCARRRFDSF